jgi:hypothetical protein
MFAPTPGSLVEDTPVPPAALYPIKYKQNYPRLNISGSIFFNHGSAALAVSASTAPPPPQREAACATAGLRTADSKKGGSFNTSTTVNTLLATARLNQKQQQVPVADTVATFAMPLSMTSSVYFTTQSRTSATAKRLAVLGASAVPATRLSSRQTVE